MAFLRSEMAFLLQQVGHNLELIQLSFAELKLKMNETNTLERTFVWNNTSVVPSARPASDGYWWSKSGAGNCGHGPGHSSGQPHDLQCACWLHSPANVRNTLSVTHLRLPHWGNQQAAGAEAGSLFKLLALSKLDSLVWGGLDKTLVNKLQKAMTFAAMQGYLSCARKNDPMTPLLDNWTGLPSKQT